MTPHSEDFARTDGAEGPLRVLVADDDLRSQRLLAALLDFAGACPVIASDGSEALAPEIVIGDEDTQGALGPVRSGEIFRVGRHAGPPLSAATKPSVVAS